jgi:hypothetical protein
VRSADLLASWRSDSGTSLAAPHVAGALALLTGAFPDSSADRQASALQAGAADLGPAGPDDGFGAGRVDAIGAYQWLTSAPDVAVTAAPATTRITSGGTATFTVTARPRNGFAAPVSLSLAGLTSAQASWTFAPATVAGGDGTAQLTIATSATLTPGTYPLRITGVGGGLTRTATVTLEVAGPPDFTLAATPSAATVKPGQSATFSVAIGALNGFTGSVAVTASNLPNSSKATFAPASLAAPGTSTLTLATSTGTRRATYTITVAGTSGTLRHTAPITVTVR